MTWQQYQAALPVLPESPTLEQWRDAVAEGKRLLAEVSEADRGMAKVILNDTLVQTGVFLGYVQ